MRQSYITYVVGFVSLLIPTCLLATPEVIVTILYDNYMSQEGLQTDWGFACLVEGLDKTILFDTGARGATLLDNVNKLAVDLNDVDVIVISHDHQDHYGGLNTFLKRNHEVDVYLLENFSEERANTVQRHGAKVVTVQGPRQICKGAWLTGPMGTQIVEQSLVLDTVEGVVVITGCAHPGIVSIVKKAQAMVTKPIHLVLGGFHLLNHSDKGIQERIAAFQDLGVQHAGPTHCSGRKTIELFEQAYGDKFIEFGVGKRLSLPLSERKAVYPHLKQKEIQ
ncbi:MBL fold metallo-hydrolase [Planctomycetota bacterium]